VNGNGQSPYYEGLLKQRVPKFSQPPAFIKVTDIGRAGAVSTRVKLWMHRPTFEFPRAGIFLSLNNGKGSCFSKLESTAEIRELCTWLSQAAEEIETVIPSLQVEEAAIASSYQQYAKAMAVMKQLNPETPEDEPNA